jgi:hypothetical protein
MPDNYRFGSPALRPFPDVSHRAGAEFLFTPVVTPTTFVLADSRVDTMSRVVQVEFVTTSLTDTVLLKVRSKPNIIIHIESCRTDVNEQLPFFSIISNSRANLNERQFSNLAGQQEMSVTRCDFVRSVVHCPQPLTLFTF